MVGLLFCMIFSVNVVFCYFFILECDSYLIGIVKESVGIISHKGFSTKHDNGC